jgi:hypothetical protein
VRERPRSFPGSEAGGGRLLDVAAPGGHGGVDGTRSGHDRAGLVPLRLVEGLAQQRGQLGTGPGVAQGLQDRQGVDTLGQILARQLPQFLLGADDVEDVVAQLEEHAEAATEG